MFFFSSRRRHTRYWRDWSSDVCSSDLESVPYMALPLWNAVQKFLLNELQEVGADPKSIDAARVMRLSGSLNQKSGKLAELLVYNGSYKYKIGRASCRERV